MGWGTYYPLYVSVAERRARAAAAARKAAKSGMKYLPVTIAGRTIVQTFWGKAWCQHLESFSDYQNRLPRGRTYVRNGSVMHLDIGKGRIEAKVMGSRLYGIRITMNPLARARWAAIKAECAGKVDSLVGLLQGKLSEPVMRVITDRDRGLFPQPSEIEKDCSCPDSAGLCKHLAAVLYGVGARLDAQPELLFVLRGVDHLELIESAADTSVFNAGADGTLPPDQLADVFGIEIAAAAPVAARQQAASRPPAPPRPGRAARAEKPRTTKSNAKLKTIVVKDSKNRRGR